MPIIKKVETLNAPQAIGPFSQAVSYSPFIFISGQLPIDPKTGKMVEPDIRIQTNRVLENINAILKESGCTLKEVVRCDLFVLDLNDFAIINQEYGKWFEQPVPPARQTFQVARLPLDALIEISCIAIHP